MLGRIKAFAPRIAPSLVWAHRLRNWQTLATGEPEESLLPSLTDRRKISVDVGAANGSYTAHLMALSRGVIAFEPVPSWIEELRRIFRDTPAVRIEGVALSDSHGQIEMRFCPTDPFRSTLEAANTLRYTPDVLTAKVSMRTLDEYALRNIGLIKIDVEGHELAMLYGAQETITREHPNILIEVEEQHRSGAVQSVFRFFRARDYLGHFLLDGKLHSIDLFDPDVHQDVRNLDTKGRRIGNYINNFIFRPRTA